MFAPALLALILVARHDLPAPASPAPNPTAQTAKKGPQLVPDAICLAILRRAGLTTVSRADPFKFVANEGTLFGAAMKGHLVDPDLSTATPPQLETVAQNRGALELFGSNPTKQFPTGVAGCLGRYK